MDGNGRRSRMAQSEPSERDQRDLVALADGSLTGRRREELEARVAGSPELQTALNRQRAGLTALRGLDLPVPLPLRERLEAERSSPSRALRRRRFAIGGVLAGAAAAVALAAVLILPSGAGGPTISEAAQLNLLPATNPSAPADPADPALLAVSAQGLPYPNLEPLFDWRSAGQRSDEIEGRDATTVFYERDGKRIGYTILSGEGVEPPKDATKTVQDGVRFAAYSDDGQQIVTWWRGGHSCVLSGEGVSEEELLELASWKGDGAVPF
jgi:anti-sigma factor RsiW